MFCSKCGNQVNVNLNYCNICGAKTGKEAQGESRVSPLNALITTIAFVALGGLGILVGLVSILLDRGLTHEAIAIISGCYLATLLGICLSLTRLMSKLIDADSGKKPEPVETYQTPVLSMPTNPQLNEYKQPVGSVTDHTTKTFDEVFVKRN
jgi:hypothetical protein